LRYERGRIEYQFLRTPHLKTRDLRCFISSSADVEGFEVATLADLEYLEADLLSFPFVAFGSLGLRDLDVGGVASIRTEISESLLFSDFSSTSIVFRFFGIGDFGDFVSITDRLADGDSDGAFFFAGLGFAGDVVGVT